MSDQPVSATVTRLFQGDQRLNALGDRIVNDCIEFSTEQQLPVSTIIGVLEMVKAELIDIALNRLP